MTRATTRERERQILSEPEVLDEICERVASGETLAQIARGWEIRYWAVHDFVNLDNERAMRYEVAKQARLEYLRDGVIESFQEVADFDVAQVLEPDGKVKAFDKLPKGVGKVLSSVDVSYDGDGNKITKLRFADRLRARESLGRHAAMFTDKIAIPGLEDLRKLSDEQLDAIITRSIAQGGISGGAGGEGTKTEAPKAVDILPGHGAPAP